MSVVRRRRQSPIRRMEGHTASQRLELARRLTDKQQPTKESDKK